MDRWAIIAADNSWFDGPLDADPTETIAADQYVVRVPPDFPAGCFWKQGEDREASGFRDVVPVSPAPLITVGHFLLTYLTFAEQVTIHTAAQTDMEVQTMLYMLQGFTDGISLVDPSISAFLGILVGKSLLTSARVTAILAGQTP